ncbi:MAG TPA: 50S ribosomal protein L11 methyltransferase [Bryobacteraceae bacterium]|nr:50S ribosomal protein L11 methyltransferase [Bryobacteraceae bacterium]
MEPGREIDLYNAEPAGVIEHDDHLEAFFDDREIAAMFGDPVPCEEIDWVQRNYDAWPPLLIGEKFFLIAPWRNDPTPAGRLRLEINPGMQCGTGWHRCTQLCLEAMERALRPGDSVLDVGTGSGILSIAAKLLGAGRVVACDIDPDATRAAPFFIGSVDAVKSDSFDLVVANISEPVIRALRADLERVARVRILSGFQDQNGEWTCLVC